MFDNEYYKKVKDIFRRPQIKVSITTYRIAKMNMLFWNRKTNPIFSIVGEELGWKTKYGEVRHEWNPCLCIMIFGIAIIFQQGWWHKKWGDISHCYWESVLSVAMNDGDFIKSMMNELGVWETMTGTHETLMRDFLKKKHLNEYDKYVKQ